MSTVFMQVLCGVSMSIHKAKGKKLIDKVNSCVLKKNQSVAGFVHVSLKKEKKTSVCFKKSFVRGDISNP